MANEIGVSLAAAGLVFAVLASGHKDEVWRLLNYVRDCKSKEATAWDADAMDSGSSGPIHEEMAASPSFLRAQAFRAERTKSGSTSQRSGRR
jgi:hypothetical protein